MSYQPPADRRVGEQTGSTRIKETTMRYMLMHKLDENAPGAFSPSLEFQQEMGSFIQEAVQAGVFLMGEGLLPTSVESARITLTDGKRELLDGPFAESKELIAGFALLQVRSKEEAVEWASRFVDLFEKTGLDIEVDVRPVAEMPPA
jgi:hypothetical protein